MIYKNEKLIFYLCSELSSNPNNAPRIPMDQLLDSLSLRQKHDQCLKMLNKKTASIRIHKMKIDKISRIAYMLLHYSDTNVSDPVFADLKKGNLRKESKLEGEGIAVSAHLAISIDPINPLGTTYDTVLEETPGLGRTTITPFLRTGVKDVFDKKFIHNKKEVSYHPDLMITGKLSQTLKEDLEAGRLSGFSLIKHNVKKAMDEDHEMFKEEQTIYIKIADETFFKKYNPITFIKEQFTKAKTAGYDGFKVHYKNLSKKNKIISIQTKLADAMDVLYTKGEPIVLKNSVEQCVPKFNSEIVNAMKKMIFQTRKQRGKKLSRKSSKVIKKISRKPPKIKIMST